MSKKIKGVLPNDTWLKKNGYGELVKAKAAKPELFAHIKKSPKR